MKCDRSKRIQDARRETLNQQKNILQQTTSSSSNNVNSDLKSKNIHNKIVVENVQKEDHVYDDDEDDEI